MKEFIALKTIKIFRIWKFRIEIYKEYWRDSIEWEADNEKES